MFILFGAAALTLSAVLTACGGGSASGGSDADTISEIWARDGLWNGKFDLNEVVLRCSRLFDPY